jgi:3',5'-cyclic AMP phosphodiesterase CpdA
MSNGEVEKTKYVRLPLYFFCFLAVIFVFALAARPSRISSSDLHPQINYYKIGLMTDIHAAGQGIRAKNTPGNVIYPNKYKTLLPEALEKMEKEEVELIINLGDVTNDDSQKHAREIKRMTAEEEMEEIWVSGNHDSEEIKETLGMPSNYYFVDKNGWRIIVLDSSEGLDDKETRIGYVVYNGGIGNAQLDWLKDALKTENDVAIAMHHPIWDKETISYINPVYEDFKNIIEQSRNVRYVFSGHWHTPYWEKEQNGIKYFGIAAFSLDGMEGFYKTIDLPYYYYNSYEPT